MTRQEAISKAYCLHIEWISEREIQQGKGFDLDRIHSSILSDYRYRRLGKTRATAGYIRELRGQLITLGKIRKTLNHKVGNKYGGI